MKKGLLAVCLFVFALGAKAQQTEVEMFMSMFQLEKKAMLADYLRLSDAEATTFWPIYTAFEAERAEVAKRRIELIGAYAQRFEGMTDEEADKLAAESFKIRAAQEKLQKKYYGKVKKAVGAKRGAQFVQFERFINTAIDNELNTKLPLIGEKL